MTPQPIQKSTRRNAIAKRDGARPPEIKVLYALKSAAFPAGRMLIASPLTLHAIISNVPRGHVLRFSALRDALARQFEADYTCPVTTGIFLRIVADAAEEERANGAVDVMPWWRMVRDDGSLLQKLPGGVARQAALLSLEGVTIRFERGVPRRVDSVAAIAHTPTV